MSGMPPQIAALPRDDRGRPVTFTAAWSSESVALVGPESRLDGQRAVFATGSYRVGDPVLSRTTPTRQRLCNLAGLCQVCAEPVPDRRWIADLRATPDEEYDGHPLLIDSWTCESCLSWSLENCPGLLSKGDALRLLLVTNWKLIPDTEYRPSVYPQRQNHFAGEPVVYVKVAALDYEERAL